MTMTREELYQSIYTHDTVYIPPHEAASAALEVTLGCSWHKCTFCDFAKDKFHIHPIEKLEHDIQILSALRPDVDSLFLLGENVFVLSTEALLSIFDLRDQYMPQAKTFAMYSRIDDILRKSPDELSLLHSRGLRALHIGVESGSDSILAECNKGITSNDTVKALLRLDEAGINYYVTIIPGLGGRNFSRLHAIETANMLNRVHPKNIWCLKLKLWKDTPLFTSAKNGLFEIMTPREILIEERLLLEHLRVENCLFEDTTVLNRYTIQGYLPNQKKELLQAVDYLLQL